MKDKFYRLGLWIVLVAILLAICIVQFSCNPVKKAYKGVAKFEPQTMQDSANFYSRAKKIIKPLPPTIRPGKTIRVPYAVDKIIKDTSMLKKYRDSLHNAYHESDSINMDECIRMASESFNSGYDNAVFDLSKQVQTVDCPPDTCPPDLSLAVAFSDLEIRYRVLDDKLSKTRTERDIYKARSKARFFYILGLILAIATGVFFSIKNGIYKNIKG